MISQSQSDIEELGASSICMTMDDQLDIVKHEIEIESKDDEPTTEDIFGSDIMLTHVSNTSSISERRESKEKSKKEIEEEEREKMQ